MAIVFCPSCDSSIYLLSPDEQACPVCAGSLTETEQVIQDRLTTSS